MTEQSHAVFLSYASEDAAAAQRICDALRAGGIDTWFDRNELRGGDAWDALIRERINTCALFLPIVSAHTEARSEGYFRLEWRLAVERSFHIADDRTFLLPIVIDATPQTSARVPGLFRERHWTQLPGGEASDDFVAHVRRLLREAPEPAVPKTGPAASAAVSRGSRWARVAVATAALGVLATGGVLAWLHRAPPAPPATHPVSANTPAAAPAAQDRQSIAVLPFENLTGRPEDAYLADGMQEEILNALARIRAFKVISRSSAEEYRGTHRNIREIGVRLGVGTVLEGSVRRDANMMRLTVQLIDTHSDRHLLATNYDRDLHHILGLQSEVAHEVADALAATVTQFERGELDHIGTNSGDAYRSYLRAVALFRQQIAIDNDARAQAISLLEEAVHTDPDYADAYALLSQAHTFSFVHTARSDDAARARASFERALAIDANLTDAYLARGVYELYVVKDRERALADLESVAQRRPNSPVAQAALAMVLRRLGRMAEAVPHFQRAWDLDPLSHAYDVGLMTTLIGLRRYPEAIAWARLHIVRFPESPMGYVAEARVAAFVQQSIEPLRALLSHGGALDADARNSLEAEVAQAEGRYRDAIGLWEARPQDEPLARLEAVAFLYHAAGDDRAAAQHFRDLKATVESQLRSGQVDSDNGLMLLSIAQSMLGEYEVALKTIERARAEYPESLDPVNGPPVSFVRSILLVRAGRTDEAYAEVARLLQVPFGAPSNPLNKADPVLLLLKNDPHYDTLIHHPPRL